MAPDAPAHTLADAPPAPPARPRVVLVGAGLASAATAMVFVGLLGIYLARRADVINTGESWLPSGTEFPIAPPTMMMFTLLISIFTVLWAANAVTRNDRAGTYIGLGLTLVLGFAYLNQATYLFSIINLPIRTEQGVLVYAIAGGHGLAVGIGMVFLALVTFRTLSGQYRRVPDGLNGAAFFWIVVTLIFPVIWYAVWISK